MYQDYSQNSKKQKNNQINWQRVHFRGSNTHPCFEDPDVSDAHENVEFLYTIIVEFLYTIKF